MYVGRHECVYVHAMNKIFVNSLEFGDQLASSVCTAGTSGDIIGDIIGDNTFSDVS